MDSLNTSDVSLAQCALEVRVERGPIFDSFPGQAFNKFYAHTKIRFSVQKHRRIDKCQYAGIRGLFVDRHASDYRAAPYEQPW